ncbi:D-serine deaminase, pyridoxal phosphate-dependent [Fontimonas thermophila]|uniref:D-serine deaminase, pyridoxal phosphate-dependent n=1 Tax=Fontimonas thermophila TaxID=1076937 RepID=A0A1I2H5W1_9GAMM|nr:DSD1 family PLP-dependent enzyme [Fontimonas thermophila]SFF25564.1 D-serine deaminase, pyridoxal phosphate-dependent [Fontimonas thermophila]
MTDRTRRLLLAGALGAPLITLAALRPRGRSGAHDDYFQTLQGALRRAGLWRPTLVIDRARLHHNIERLKTHLPKGKHYRIVAKSLPSLKLIDVVRAATGTRRLMSFHQPFANFVAARMSDAELLFGKPMPIGAAQRFFAEHRNSAFDPAAQIEWLIDTPQRLAEYAELARARRHEGLGPLKINLEIDVGLHRGGFRDPAAVAEAIRAIDGEPALRFSGFMGYEAHVGKLPAWLGGGRPALSRAMARYAAFLDAARAVRGAGFDPDQLTLNAGGSTTYQLYDETAPCNELAMGSGLVMPSDFDLPTLADHLPACFIATPVLKALDRTELPGLEALSGLLRVWDPNTAQAFFLYGGYWLADPVSPPGLQRNALWGHSSNQDLLNGAPGIRLAAGDHVFLRPRQSESVFLQFGDLAVFDRGEIVDFWPVFQHTA